MDNLSKKPSVRKKAQSAKIAFEYRGLYQIETAEKDQNDIQISLTV